MPTADAKLTVLLVTAPPPGHDEAAAEGAFTKVDGRECLMRCVDLFSNRPEIVQVLTAFPPEEAEEGVLAGFDLKRRFGGHLAFSGVKIAPPAAGWHGQIASMAPLVDAAATHVLIHDAARPAVAFTELDALAEAARQDAKHVLALAIPAPSELIETDGSGGAVGYRPADAFALLAWPRVYPKSDLPALSAGKEPPASRLRLIDASPLNVRCNGGADAKLVQALLKLLPQPRKEGPLSPFEEAQW